MKKKKIATSIAVVLLLTTISSVVFESRINAASSSTFKDVPNNHWAASAINYAVSKGYFKGYEDGTFKPNAVVTRAEFATLIGRISSNKVQSEVNRFVDLKGHWSEGEVHKAVGMGFIHAKDYPSGFKPSTAISRVEMSKWLAGGLAASSSDYKTALVDTKETLLPIAEYFKGGVNKADYPFIAVALGTGLLSGYPDGTFGPKKSTSRAEAAVIIQRFEGVQNKEASSFRGLNEMREVGTTGTNLTTVTPYKYRDDINFTNIFGRNITLRSGAGKVKLHRLIVMDVKKWDDINSIYGPMFVDKTSKRPIENDTYDVFIDVTVTPVSDSFRREHFINGAQSRLHTGLRIGGNVINTFGIITLPFNGDPTFFSNGNETRFWSQTSIDKKGGSEFYTLNTDDGKGVLIYLEGNN